jgi:hypothetical protein
MILSSPLSWPVAALAVTRRGAELVCCAPFWDSFRRGAMDSVSALKNEGGGRVEMNEAASSVLLASKYGFWWGWADIALILWLE